MQKLFVVVAVLAVISLAQAQKYTHAQALAKIQAAGVGISSSGGCSDPSKPTCTSLEQIRTKTIDSGAVVLKQASNCAVTITAGTEVGHAAGTYSHANGYKLDYSLNTCLNNYIKGHYAFIGNRPGDGAPQYQSAAGNIYALEGNHWDVVYY